MPRKRPSARLSSYDVPVTDPNDRNAVDDTDLVRHYLVDFDEFAVLPQATREALITRLADALAFVRAGVRAGKRGMSDTALAQQIFISDVARALEEAGLPATRWRKKYDLRKGESLLFRLARELAEVAGIVLPKDLKLAGQRAVRHQYGVMSPAMETAQAAELRARSEPGNKSARGSTRTRHK
jgi:hypothetical protein